MAAVRTGRGAGVEGCPAERLMRSPCVRCRSPAAAQTSMTWKGGMVARADSDGRATERLTSPTLEGTRRLSRARGSQARRPGDLEQRRPQRLRVELAQRQARVELVGDRAGRAQELGAPCRQA